MCLQTSQHGRRAKWLNKELLLYLKGKIGFMTSGRGGRHTKKSTVMSVDHTEKIGKAKVQLELNVAISVKNNKMYFY